MTASSMIRAEFHCIWLCDWAAQALHIQLIASDFDIHRPIALYPAEHIPMCWLHFFQQSAKLMTKLKLRLKSKVLEYRANFITHGELLENQYVPSIGLQNPNQAIQLFQ